LFATSTCKDAWRAALEDLEKCKIEKVTWSLSQGTDHSKAVATFHLTGGFSWSENGFRSNDVSAYNFMTDQLARKIIDVHYGSDKDVKTFNCAKHIVRSGGEVSRKTRWGREKEYQDGFDRWLRTKFESEADKEMKAATLRLRADIVGMMATDEFRQARQEALVGFCKNDITKALLPWHGMDQQTLQDAWDQFICTAIMRT
jgi:hypothetical protein